MVFISQIYDSAVDEMASVIESTAKTIHNTVSSNNNNNNTANPRSDHGTGPAARLTALSANLADKYVVLVKQNPEQASHVESAVRMISYVIPGGSQESSELLYAISNTLRVIHDYILRFPKATDPPPNYIRLGVVISYIRAVEVLLELLTRKFFGEKWKLRMITLIETAKAAIRLHLLFSEKYGQRILASPMIPVVDRAAAADHIEAISKVNVQTTLQHSNHSLAKPPVWKGSRSGCIVRSLSTFTRNFEPPFDGAVAILENDIRSVLEDPALEASKRLFLFNGDVRNVVTWTTAQDAAERFRNYPQKASAEQLGYWRKVAELIYILRPLLTVLAMMKVKRNHRWIPFVVSFCCDLLSHLIHSKQPRGTELQETEIAKRRYDFLFYLLRSPLFDDYTKDGIISALNKIGNTIPLTHFITNAAAAYLPVWQKVFFYTWTT